jgi:hypothetical protein
MTYAQLLADLLTDTGSSDLRMKKHSTREFDLGDKDYVTFGDVYGCRYIFDMDAHRKYDRDSEDDKEPVYVRGRVLRKAHVFDGYALFVYDPRDFPSDYDRDAWLRRAALVGFSLDSPDQTTKGPEKVHWLWLRVDGRRLDPKIVRRVCASWFALNDPADVAYTLWTNLKDPDELDEWLSDVPEDDYEEFVSQTVIRYLDETCAIAPDLSDEIERPSSKDLFATTDVLRLLILQRHGGYYADFNDVLPLCPLKTLARSERQSLLLAYEGPKFQRAINNFFLYYDGKSKAFPKMVEDICKDRVKIEEHVAQGLFPKALLTVAVDVLERVLGGIKPPFNPYDVLSVASDLGDLRYAVFNALPDDDLAHRLVFGSTFLDVAQEILKLYERVIVAIGLGSRLRPVFDKVYETCACPALIPELCDFLNKTFKDDPSTAEDIARIRDYLADARGDIGKSTDLCASSALFERIFQFTNIGRHVREMACPPKHDALYHCALDTGARHVEFKFDTFLVHLGDATSTGRSKDYDACKVLLG